MANMNSKSLWAAILGTLPFILALFLVLTLRLPVRTGMISMYLPYISLAFVYYWVLHGRSYLPIWAIFILGIFEDMVTLGPPGLNSLLLIAVSVGLENQRRFFINRPFSVGWAGFSIICLGVGILRWLLEGFYNGALLPISPTAIQTLVTMLTYPFFGWIFGRLRAALP